MPSLIRLLAAIGLICGIGYAAMLTLATFVKPQTREITVTVSPDRFVKQR